MACAHWRTNEVLEKPYVLIWAYFSCKQISPSVSALWPSVNHRKCRKAHYSCLPLERTLVSPTERTIVGNIFATSQNLSQRGRAGQPKLKHFTLRQAEGRPSSVSVSLVQGVLAEDQLSCKHSQKGCSFVLPGPVHTAPLYEDTKKGNYEWYMTLETQIRPLYTMACCKEVPYYWLETSFMVIHSLQ